MINRVGYTDNRTSFGAYFKVDGNGYINKLYNSSVGSEDILSLAKDLRHKAPNHELEIIKLSEGSIAKGTIRNNNTGAEVEFRLNSLDSALKNILESLNSMAKNKVAFWNDTTKNAKLYRLLTGQKDNSITKI